MTRPEVLLSGLGMPESARWHDGRLWFANWVGQQIVAVAPDGTAEFRPTPAEQPMGWSIDWLPDGRLVTTGDKLRRQEQDGRWVTVADQAANEIVVDGRGNTYIDGAKLNFDPESGWAPEPGWIELVTPDGQRRQVADEIQFPNGMVTTPDDRTLIISESFAAQLTAFDIGPDGGLSNRRVFAGGLGPDGICVDADGAVWTGSGGYGVVRVAAGGQILQRVELAEHRAPLAMALGGADRRTLFILTVEWRIEDGAAGNLPRLASGLRTGQILALPVSVPGAGRP